MKYVKKLYTILYANLVHHSVGFPVQVVIVHRRISTNGYITVNSCIEEGRKDSLVISESFQNYKNGAVSNQLSDIGREVSVCVCVCVSVCWGGSATVERISGTRILCEHQSL